MGTNFDSTRFERSSSLLDPGDDRLRKQRGNPKKVGDVNRFREWLVLDAKFGVVFSFDPNSKMIKLGTIQYDKAKELRDGTAEDNKKWKKLIDDSMKKLLPTPTGCKWRLGGAYYLD